MNKKRPGNYMLKESFARAYLCLEDYIFIYEDGVDIVLEARNVLCNAYAEEHKGTLNYETARDILDSCRNERGAGRKPKVSEETKQMIRQKKKEGQSADEIASTFNISSRYVYLICQ